MRRTLGILAVLALVFAVPMLGAANDIKDGQDCAESEQGATVENAVLDGADPTTAELDRGAVCVSDGDDANGADVYVGGEVQAEEEGNPDYAGACGAIIVGGNALAGEADWDNAGEDGIEGTEDDEHCD